MTGRVEGERGGRNRSEEKYSSTKKTIKYKKELNIANNYNLGALQLLIEDCNKE